MGRFVRQKGSKDFCAQSPPVDQLQPQRPWEPPLTAAMSPSGEPSTGCRSGQLESRRRSPERPEPARPDGSTFVDPAPRPASPETSASARLLATSLQAPDARKWRMGGPCCRARRALPSRSRRYAASGSCGCLCPVRADGSVDVASVAARLTSAHPLVASWADGRFNLTKPRPSISLWPPGVARAAHAAPHVRMMHRNPMWLVDVSTVSDCRAAGRNRRQ